jgi:argininosuccinate lyase
VSEPGKMWGGRFRGPLDPEFARFQRSLPVDYVLADADLDVNRAWARALGAAGVLTGDDVERIEAALEQIEQDWLEEGIPVGDEEDVPEDIHSLVEQQLGQHVGELSKRIHTGRSRNDQVATDLKLWLRSELRQLLDAMFELLQTLVQKAEAHADLPMPGYTHLQRAQPITVGHHALAHAEAFWRDCTRFLDAWRRMDTCPLGSGALAGTPLQIDRQALATELGFLGGPTHNSLDAVASRDHACELLFAASMTMVNLSRLAEDYVFFASHEAGFVRFGDAVATGSSLMPQKRNPDAMELIRGKTGMVLGCLNALLVTLKGLPLAYDRDLQEDKHGLALGLEQTRQCIEMAALAVQNAHFDQERCRREAGRGYLNATDLADLLVAEGVPFRDAHEQVGAAVNRAIELGVELQDLPPAERKSLLPQLRGVLTDVLSVDAVLARRTAIGGTAPECVRQEVEHWRARLQELRSGSDFGPPEDDEADAAGEESG